MSINYSKKEIQSKSIKFIALDDDNEIGRAYLYVLKNELHDNPFGFIEDVFVDENYRGQGIGSELVKQMKDEARSQNCYKIIMTSRYSKPKVHKLYEKLGFEDWGKEFRMNIS